ncbi:carboxymuconolactone decarboxylase family protein [Streptomyces meridianus]|uniref:Carboxymuconolactone decarboxylase family protein n=1 Tax=Streptomyces meridianus TaxID=2938945 RepID=A0ABT0XCZ9_9ACTN|nr:carboxymuconolactone decarboxylase family protein [Streptomyces meridianus]MCM2580402.1 carboxymuconolactone decarboxylase family protein [Streptomyces meridianus]
MARISLDPPRTLVTRAVEWYSRRTYGKVLDPARAAAHNRRVLVSVLRLEQGVARWHRLDEALKTLAVAASAASIGCSWCMDFGYWESHRRGMDVRKLSDVPRWRDSDVYTPLERDVMEYAEAMTATPPTVDDALVARLREHLDDAALVELTAMVALENMRSRINASLGLTSQGFRDSCDIPVRG